MNIYRYETKGGKDLIAEYINGLPKLERAEGLRILSGLESNSIDYLKDVLDTRQIEKKLYEIKFKRHNRMFYVVADAENLYILHACKKQKGKAEQFELNTARLRAKELGGILGKAFI